MRVLLDECLPKKLKAHVVADFVRTVPEAGWAGKQNGELLCLAEQDFDVFVTNDQNIQHQQVISRFDLALSLTNQTSCSLSIVSTSRSDGMILAVGFNPRKEC